MRLLVIGAGGFIGAHVRGQAASGRPGGSHGGPVRPDGSPGHARVNLAEDSPAEIAALIDEVAPDAVVNCAGATAGDAEAARGRPT